MTPFSGRERSASVTDRPRPIDGGVHHFAGALLGLAELDVTLR